MENLKVGDVFFANKSFEFGRPVSVGETKYIKGVSLVQVSDTYFSPYVTSRITGYDPKTGKSIVETITLNSYCSKQRVGKEYVVESVELKGGSSREFIRNEPHIVARRLKSDGTYDPNGELITFVGTPPAQTNFNTAAEVKVHRKMKRVVNFI